MRTQEYEAQAPAVRSPRSLGESAALNCPAMCAGSFCCPLPVRPAGPSGDAHPQVRRQALALSRDGLHVVVVPVSPDHLLVPSGDSGVDVFDVMGVLVVVVIASNGPVVRPAFVGAPVLRVPQHLVAGDVALPRRGFPGQGDGVRPGPVRRGGDGGAQVLRHTRLA